MGVVNNVMGVVLSGFYLCVGVVNLWEGLVIYG